MNAPEFVPNYSVDDYGVSRTSSLIRQAERSKEVSSRFVETVLSS